MKTKITELFGIEYPVILPGMSWISVPELVRGMQRRRNGLSGHRPSKPG